MTAAERAALEYLDRGLSVIPIRPGGKKPLVRWREYQQRRPTHTEIGRWYRREPRAGVAIVCGRVSGLGVLDFDPRNGEALQLLGAHLPDTVTAESGGQGQHRYVGLPGTVHVRKVGGLLGGLDLLAERSYVVAPPTIHPSGRPYRWLPGHALGDVPIAPLPPVVRQLVGLLRAQPPMPTRSLGRGSRITVEVALGRLSGVRRAGAGWVARCPSHDDRTPSLSLAAGAGGRLLLYCHAGCPFTAVRAGLEKAHP